MSKVVGRQNEPLDSGTGSFLFVKSWSAFKELPGVLMEFAANSFLKK
jgi:hypothetical protein